MITMNDKINIELNLTKAHLYIASLSIASYELKNIDEETSKQLKNLREIFIEHIEKLDYES